MARPWPGLVAVCLATLVAGTLAATTRPGVHPDEMLHLEAFRYFETRVRVDPRDVPSLHYDPYGTSKVLNRDLGYLILGRAGRLVLGLRPGADPLLVYRLLNVLLLPLALLPLLLAGAGPIPLRAVFWTCLAIPQVVYVFAYANSDAFALTLALWLLALASSLSAREGRWPLPAAALFGLVAGLTASVKPNFLLALLLPLAILAPRLRRGPGTLNVVVPLALLVGIPLGNRLARPWLDVGGREAHAAPGFRPSAPTDPTAYPLAQGATLGELLLERGFLVRSAQSFWGVYGHMDVFHAWGVYVVAGLLGLLGAGLTLRTAWRSWGDLPPPLLAGLGAAPLAIAANVVASFANSAFLFFQPQGRYLFPSLGAVALLLCGTAGHESPGARRVRRALALSALGLAAFSLLGLALPRLR